LESKHTVSTIKAEKQICIDNTVIDLSVPKIMGILNITKDSFYSDSRYNTDEDLLKNAEKHLIEGATFLDIGAMSSRPGAMLIDEIQEQKIIQNAVRILNIEFPNVCISVDTFRANVAKSAIDHGAKMINDISGFSFDENLLEVITSQKVAYVLMHIEGSFENMHNVVRPDTKDKDIHILDQENIAQKVCYYFNKKIDTLQKRGVDNIILDPGFGFSKTLTENHELLHQLDVFQRFSQPILVGLSRKSMIYKVLNNRPEEALNGTTILNTLAILKGANILRVHDVKECKEIIELLFC